MEIQAKAVKYVKRQKPFSYFIIIDNKDFSIKALERHEITAEMLHLKYDYVQLIPYKLNQEFEVFKDKYLNKEYYDLPDYSFLRYDFIKPDPELISPNNKFKIYKKELSYRATFKDEFQMRESTLVKEVEKNSSRKWGKNNLFNLLERYSKTPEVFETYSSSLLVKLEDASVDVQQQILEKIRETRYYKEKAIDESCSPLSLYKVNTLHLLSALLKGETEKYKELRILYDAQELSKLTLCAPYDLIFKQMELIIASYFEKTPYHVHPFNFNKEDLEQFFYSHPGMSSDQGQLILTLEDFCELSQLNQKINNTITFTEDHPIPPLYLLERLSNERNRLITDLILAETYRLTEGLYKNAPSQITRQKYDNLKNYILFLNGHECLPFQKLYTERSNAIKSKYSNPDKPEELTIKMVDQNNGLELIRLNQNQLNQKEADCIYYTGNPDLTYNSAFSAMEYLKNVIMSSEQEFPVITSSFITNSDIVKYRLNELMTLCNRYHTLLFAEDSFHLILSRPAGDKTKVEIISLNLNLKSQQQINNLLFPVRAESYFQKLKQKYLLPTYPHQSPARLIDEHLKKNSTPESKGNSCQPKKGL